MYNCHSKRGSRGYWRCHNYSKRQADQRCRARCVIVNGVVKSMTGGPHNHSPHDEKINKFMRRNEMFNDIDKGPFEITDCVNLDDFMNDHEEETTLIPANILS